MTEPSERAQELASRHEGLSQLAEMEREAQRGASLAKLDARDARKDLASRIKLERLGGCRVTDMDYCAALAKKAEIALLVAVTHHRFLKGLGTDFFRWLAEHHERTMT